MRGIAILGSTGSIGKSAIDVARAHPDRLRVHALVAGSNWEALRGQIDEVRPRKVVLTDPGAAERLRRELPRDGVAVLSGLEGVREVVSDPETDVVLSAITGAAGLPGSLAALECGKRLALANKESLVMAGPILMEMARAKGIELVPVDSEHSAVFQSMKSGRREEVRRVILTASGGPFREWPAERLGRATRADALKHPTWNMGEKITIDSATLMNKALEVIEARWLFDLRVEQIEVVVHPQSIIHSMVEFEDASVIAQMGPPDMRTPIQYALTYPDRPAGRAPRLDFREVRSLTFEPPDLARFPGLGLGFEAARVGGTMGAVLNAANEEAVRLFLAERIRFPEIARTVARVMERHRAVARPDLEQVLAADAWAREETRRWTT